MKFKYWLVVLLALILPLKGAVAAAGVRCHVPASAAVLLGSSQHVQGPSSHGVHHGHEPAAAHLAASAHGDHDGADGQTVVDASCLACAAICAASPLPPAIAVQVPVVEPARDWSDLAPPAPPRRALAGLERPPRTI